MKEHRGNWGSNIGFILAAVGSAVGLGNIWGFPYKMGASGGGIFLLMYLILAALVGVTVLLGELSLGRKYQMGPVGAYRQLCRKFTFLGYFSVFSGFLIMSFYSVLGGIVLKYVVGFAGAIFNPQDADIMTMSSGDYFGSFVCAGPSMYVFFAIFMAASVIIVSGGVAGGIERFTKIAMPALAVLLIAVIVYVATLDGAADGYRFMFGIHTDAIRELGIWSITKTAAGQMFFSLSLAMGIMLTYGSYLPKETKLVKNSVIIATADTIVAVMAGMAVMPAVFAFGLEPGGGPGLLFVTLHSVFADGMGGEIGALMGFIFYGLVFIAAITSSISILEGSVTFVMDIRREKGMKMNRGRFTVIIGALVLLFAIPVAFDGLGSGVGGGAIMKTPAELFGIENVKVWCDCWLDFYDVITEGILMPLGAFGMCIVIGWIVGIDSIKTEIEATPGVKMNSAKWFDICFKVIAPVVLIIVLIAQITSFFG